MKKKGLLLVLAVGLLSLAVPVMVSAKGGQPPAQAPRASETAMLNGGATQQDAQRGSWLNGGLSLVDATAAAAGLETVDVVAALQAGAVYADLAPLDAIVDEIMDVRSAALAQAVADGRFTQEQADTMLAQMATDLLEQLNTPWTAQGSGNGTQFENAQSQDGSGYRGSQGMRGSGRTDRPMLNADCLYGQP